MYFIRSVRNFFVHRLARHASANSRESARYLFPCSPKACVHAIFNSRYCPERVVFSMCQCAASVRVCVRFLGQLQLRRRRLSVKTSSTHTQKTRPPNRDGLTARSNASVASTWFRNLRHVLFLVGLRALDARESITFGRDHNHRIPHSVAMRDENIVDDDDNDADAVDKWWPQHARTDLTTHLGVEW